MNKQSQPDMKYCVAHLGEKKMVPRSEFDPNALTSDGLHVACRACVGPNDVAHRSALAHIQLTRAGISHRSQIVRRFDDLPASNGVAAISNHTRAGA